MTGLNLSGGLAVGPDRARDRIDHRVYRVSKSWLPQSVGEQQESKTLAGYSEFSARKSRKEFREKK